MTLEQLQEQAAEKFEKEFVTKDGFVGTGITRSEQVKSFLFSQLALAYQQSRVDTLKELLGSKWEAVREKEAISPMRITSISQAENVRPQTDATICNLQYVKVWDIEKLLETAADLLTRLDKTNV